MTQPIIIFDSVIKRDKTWHTKYNTLYRILKDLEKEARLTTTDKRLKNLLASLEIEIDKMNEDLEMRESMMSISKIYYETTYPQK